MTADEKQIRVYGLTGGIGSGKSVVAERLEAKGIGVIDADTIGHEVLADDPGAQAEIVSAFGKEVVAEDDTIDREKLALRVFGDSAARLRLNAIMHPRIHVRVLKKIMEYVEQGHKAVVIDAAILAENGKRESWLHGLILVLSRESVRLERLVTLRNMARDDALRRIKSQTPPESKICAADWVIHNDGTLQELQRAADALADTLLKTS